MISYVIILFRHSA